MRVFPVFNNNLYRNITFQSNIFDDENVLGYDDVISQQKRDLIREHYDSWHMPYRNIDKTRKTEYGMQKILGELISKPKKVDFKSVLGLPVYNVCCVGEKSFRGQTLADNYECLDVLKESGIERVVDLLGYSDYKEAVEKRGLEYFSFRMDDFIWQNHAFKTLDRVKSTAKSEIIAYEIENPDEYMERSILTHERQKRKFIDKFVNFINFMQKDYFYIGCEYGKYKTDDALLLNSVFNPKFATDNFNVDGFKYEDLRNLYNNLEPEDKAKMGWTKEFDENVLVRINKAEQEYLKEQEESNRRFFRLM